MSPADYEHIAFHLVGTRANVYTIAKSVAGYDWTDADFDALEKTTGTFRCQECSTWKDRAEGDADVPGICAECVNEMNETEGGDE